MSEPLHISTTMGRELTLMAAQASPTKAKTTNMMGWMELYTVVRTKPSRKHTASRTMPAMMVRFRPILEAMTPMGM